jgi:hypothetical protein
MISDSLSTNILIISNKWIILSLLLQLEPAYLKIAAEPQYFYAAPASERKNFAI